MYHCPGYSYVDGNGLVQSAAYVSDPVNGFRVAATNLPVGPAVPTDEKVLAIALDSPTPAVSAVPAVPVSPSADAVAVPIVPQPSVVIQSAVSRLAIKQDGPAPVVEQVVEQPAENPVATEILSAEQQATSEVRLVETPAAPNIVSETTIQQLVTPVQDTPEVQAAKAAHLAAVEETKVST